MKPVYAVVIVCCYALLLPVAVTASDDDDDELHGEMIDYVAKVGQKSGLSKEHQAIVVKILHDKIPNDVVPYSKMTDQQKEDIHKKWQEAKKEIEAKLGSESNDQWRKFIEMFEQGTESMDHGKTGDDRRRRSLLDSSDQ